MSTAKQDAMIWMNHTFGPDMDAAAAGTPIPRKLLIAIGIQETFYIWAKMYKTARPEDVLSVCVGDTIDFPTRQSAWPKNRSELEAHPKGHAMFKVARTALERIAEVNSGYRTAARNPDKFCHGFGMFQYDIQFFKNDPTFFLEGTWATWKGTLGRGMSELKDKCTQLYGANKSRLTHDESVYLGIAYNRGAARTKGDIPTKRFKQGFKDSDGVYYGEHIDTNLKAMNGLF
ncbi:SH3 domain-containing protein [Sinorhizobium meliloti]|uniref:hypothetical protein n=1 Tax=Rhizobium meliloti TaxID=382 RepID=UPI00299E0F9C|nr:SH3 domain-containing protein [Sinorhizobium meliloti]MDX0221145.1 SH3 domain-containing protein [Sinorhizobium meliloti]MDX0227320.1 SH3 domain-containing protein [Sinorhizobium meliloti]